MVLIKIQKLYKKILVLILEKLILIIFLSVIKLKKKKKFSVLDFNVPQLNKKQSGITMLVKNRKTNEILSKPSKIQLSKM